MFTKKLEIEKDTSIPQVLSQQRMRAVKEIRTCIKVFCYKPVI